MMNKRRSQRSRLVNEVNWSTVTTLSRTVFTALFKLRLHRKGRSHCQTLSIFISDAPKGQPSSPDPVPESNTLFPDCDQQCLATTTPSTPLSSPPRSHPTLPFLEHLHRHPPNSILPAAAVSPKMSARPRADQFVVRLGSTISDRQARECH